MTDDEFDLEMGQGNTCSRCGQPCRGLASRNEVKAGKVGETEWFCHPSTPGHPDCYHLATVYDSRRSAADELTRLADEMGLL